MAYVVYQRNRDPVRWPAAMACLAAAALFCASALTYHYPTEVVGGIVTAIAWLALLQIAFWDSLRRELFGRPRRAGAVQAGKAAAGPWDRRVDAESGDDSLGATWPAWDDRRTP